MGCSSSSSSILATTSGCEIVCPQAIGNATFAYARRRSESGTKRSRGIDAMAARTRSSATAGRSSCASSAAGLSPLPESPTPLELESLELASEASLQRFAHRHLKQRPDRR